MTKVGLKVFLVWVIVSRYLQSSRCHRLRMKWTVYKRSSKKTAVTAGKTVATITNRYPIDSGLMKFGVTPGGGSPAGRKLSSRDEFIASTAECEEKDPTREPSCLF